MLGDMLNYHSRGERYRMEVQEGELTLTISRALYEHMLERLAGREVLKTMLLEIRGALYTDVVKFELIFPFIRLPNRAHRRIDWATLWKRAEQVSFLLNLCNYLSLDSDDLRLLLSEDPQLMAIEAGCVREGAVSCCPIEIGFSQVAFDVLTEECPGDVTVREAEQAILTAYVGMSCRTKKEKARLERDFAKYKGSFVDIIARVRAGGTPRFVVPGQCACLGANPDEFRHSLSLCSHNMDTPLQQLSTLAGIVSFWNDFLTPRVRRRRERKALTG